MSLDFFEPYIRGGDDVSLDELRADIRQLEDAHRAIGINLTGRIIHVCHYLPIQATLNDRPVVPSPPLTPPASPTLPLAFTAPPTWTLSPRYGHSAMISGIQSLSATHEQLIIGWTGDVHSPNSNEHIPSNTISPDERAALDGVLADYQSKDNDQVDDKVLRYVPVWLDDLVAHGHYEGFCKEILWPLFHYLLWQDVATENPSPDRNYPQYEAANAAFASKIAEVYRPGDLIWVHDYHCLLVPRLLRELVPEVIVGLFVHTPFPSSEVFRCLPRRKEILEGMLGANLICFQTYSYSRHFASACVRVCGYETTPRGIDSEGHVTAIMHCPVGVDAERVGRDTMRPGIQPKLEALRTLYEGKKIIVGRDKLDSVKGVLQKLKAFEKLLQTHKEWIGNVVMIQVTSPALTDSPKLERMVSELVSHINGEYGSLDFIPVHHYHQALNKDEFYALLSVADVAVITPLRDGMNTTSMEFVIAQGRTNHSPLVLSEFMGISKHMEDAVHVNPWNLCDVAAGINKALLMSEEEKAERQEKLYKVVTTHTSHTWAALLVKMLLGSMDIQGQARMTPYLPRVKLRDRYDRSRKRLFLFDYDGTLAPIVKTPSMAIPSSDALRALAKLSADPKNLVYIISGRDGAFLELHLGHLSQVGFSAEHGGFIRERGSKEWVDFTKNLDMEWMKEVEQYFNYYTERTTGSYVEKKKSSVVWHYRQSDPEWGLFQCRQCHDLLENNLAHKRPIEVLVGKKNLEVRPIAVNKGEIVKRILYENPDAEFIFCAGDDKTDEDMFRALLLFPPGTTEATMEEPISMDLVNGYENGDGNGNDKSMSNGDETVEVTHPSVKLVIQPESVFTTVVGHSSKRTLAGWHVTTPQEVIEHMLDLVGDRGEDHEML